MKTPTYSTSNIIYKGINICNIRFYTLSMITVAMPRLTHNQELVWKTDKLKINLEECVHRTLTLPHVDIVLKANSCPK